MTVMQTTASSSSHSPMSVAAVPSSPGGDRTVNGPCNAGQWSVNACDCTVKPLAWPPSSCAASRVPRSSAAEAPGKARWSQPPVVVAAAPSKPAARPASAVGATRAPKGATGHSMLSMPSAVQKYTAKRSLKVWSTVNGDNNDCNSMQHVNQKTTPRSTHHPSPSPNAKEDTRCAARAPSSKPNRRRRSSCSSNVCSCVQSINQSISSN